MNHPACNVDVMANCSLPKTAATSKDQLCGGITNSVEPEALGKIDGLVYEGIPDPLDRRPLKSSACEGIPDQGLKRGPKSSKYYHWTEIPRPIENPAEVARSRQHLVRKSCEQQPPSL